MSQVPVAGSWKMDLPSQLALLLGCCTSMPDLVDALRGIHKHCKVQTLCLLGAEILAAPGHGVLVLQAWGVP